MTQRDPAVRAAGPDDAEQVAALHADSWRRHYRGAYADAYLDGDVQADRRAIWSSRLAAPADSVTVVAEDEQGLAGFVHVMLDEDAEWGSLVDNLHVAHDRRRSGIGAILLAHAGRGVLERAAHPSAYLWVLEQNAAAQRFYQACGGIRRDKAPVPPPRGDASNLNGSPFGLRIAWPDVSVLARLR
jgi:ribosomal protein S18 acetylase RimI-like enzyme